jgi:hypothetical protein
VSLAVASGVVSALGARVLGEMFGGNNSIDLGALVREFAKQVDPIVRRAIADNERDKLLATARGLETLFMDYYNAPREQLLGDLHTRTVLGVSEAERLGLHGVASYAICGSLMLSVYQEQYLQSQNNGDRLNLVRGANQLVKGVPVLTSTLREATASRFGPVTHFGSLIDASSPLGMFFYLADGQMQPLLSKDQAETRRANHIETVFRSAENELLSGLYVVRDQWARAETKYATA